jgi:hypothetical protein
MWYPLFIFCIVPAHSVFQHGIEASFLGPFIMPLSSQFSLIFISNVRKYGKVWAIWSMGITVLLERPDVKCYEKVVTECEKKINFKPPVDKAHVTRSVYWFPINVLHNILMLQSVCFAGISFLRMRMTVFCVIWMTTKAIWLNCIYPSKCKFCWCVW